MLKGLFLLLACVLTAVWIRLFSYMDMMLHPRFLGGFRSEVSAAARELPADYLPRSMFPYDDPQFWTLPAVFACAFFAFLRIMRNHSGLWLACFFMWLLIGVGLFGLSLALAEERYLHSLQRLEPKTALIAEVISRDFQPRKGHCNRRVELLLEGLPPERRILRVNCGLAFSPPFTELRAGGHVVMEIGVDPHGNWILLGIHPL